MARYLFPFTATALSNRGDPFLELHREMNRLFDDASRGLGGGRDTADMALMAPRIDIHESENALEVTAELPGVSQNDVDLRIEGDVLTIRGEKRLRRHLVRNDPLRIFKAA
jgi:HSP20 family protein